MDGHDAGVDSAAIPQFDQCCIRLLLDEFFQPIQLPASELRRPSTPVRLGRDRASFPPTLEEPTDPCRADPVELGDMLPAATLLIAGLHDPLPQIH